MLFPVRDSIPSRRTPAVNLLLIAACTVVFLYQLALGPRLDELLAAVAFVPARLFDTLPAWSAPRPDYGLAGNLATMVASMFLHGGWLHLIGNVWFLYVFGDNVEDALGHLGYLLFYLGGGIAGTVAHALTAPSSPVPTIGASGAIAAVLGAYLAWFPHSRVHTLVFLGFFITMAELPAIVFLGFWFILQFFQGTLSLAAASQLGGVAWFAHVGGFVFGFAVASFLRARGSVQPARPRPNVWYRH